MDFVIPAIPPVVLVLLNFFSPYIVSLLTSYKASANTKKIVALVVSFVVSVLVLGVSIWAGWVPLDGSPTGIITLVVLSFVVQQVAYKNFLEKSATAVMQDAGVGATK